MAQTPEARRSAQPNRNQSRTGKPPRTPKQKKKQKHTGRIIIAAVICLAVICGAAFAWLCRAGSAGTIFPNVTISGVEVGGMTCEEAQYALTEALAARPPENNLGVVFLAETEDGASAVVKIPLSSAEVDTVGTVARAWNIGNEADTVGKGTAYLHCMLSHEDVTPVYADSDTVEALLDEMDLQIGQEQTAPTWENDGTQLIVTKGIPGNKLDREALRQDIFNRMSAMDIVELAQGTPQFTVTLAQALPEELDFDAIYQEVYRYVENAQFDKANKVFTLGSDGISFDVDYAKSLFENLGWGETGYIPLNITPPSVTIDDLQPYLYQDVLGTCTTSISGTENRLNNVRLAAAYFSGAVLLPGEEFSYNGIVGQRTRERGFLDAPAYVSGQTVQETGGGICQGSSTIYLAALRANLEIVERYNHGYIVGYVPDGMDATVYYGALDFRFKNNTAFPIKVVGTVSGRTLTVNIMGTKTDNITVEMTNELISTENYSTVYQADPSVPAGTSKVSVTPYTGKKVKVYRNVYDNGVLISSTLESTNTYKSRNKVILVNPADAARYGIR